VVTGKREREKKGRSVHSIPIKKSTIRGKERKREHEKKKRAKERRKKTTADRSIVFTYLYCLGWMIYHYR
jgi:hypothetical protein